MTGMNLSELPEPLRRRLAERANAAPTETVRSFLHGAVSDAEDFDEIRAGLRRVAAVTTFGLYEDLAAIEAVLANPGPDGELARMIARDANWVLDEFSDAAAARFLSELAQMHRDVIAEAESQRP
jgi:hypothetical protein